MYEMNVECIVELLDLSFNKNDCLYSRFYYSPFYLKNVIHEMFFLGKAI